jgi:hypothetical protein
MVLWAAATYEGASARSHRHLACRMTWRGAVNTGWKPMLLWAAARYEGGVSKVA